MRPRATWPICIRALVLAALSFCLPISAMDRWAALSQIESGDKDDVVGAAGEISRYQMKPELWRRYASAIVNWRDADQALTVARSIMNDRLAEFEQAFHRAATDAEFYILWNAPGQIRSPSKAVRQRAERFCNLVDSP